MTDTIKVEKDGTPTVFSGKDAVDCFAIVTLRAALKMYANHGMIPNRAWSITSMVKKAAEYTGGKYPANRKGALAAYMDLETALLRAKEKVEIIHAAD